MNTVFVGIASQYLPSLTITYQISCIGGAIIRWIWFGSGRLYQSLPGGVTIPNTPTALHVSTPTKCYQTLPGHRSGSTPPMDRFTNRPPPLDGITHSDDTMCYVGLELVVYGAVELGDVMLFFVGEQGLTGLEVYARLGWHFD